MKTIASIILILSMNLNLIGQTNRGLAPQQNKTNTNISFKQEQDSHWRSVLLTTLLKNCTRNKLISQPKLTSKNKKIQKKELKTLLKNGKRNSKSKNQTYIK